MVLQFTYVILLTDLDLSISRRMTLGSFRKFQADDYLMVIVLGFYTSLIVTINIVANNSSNLLPPGFKISSLTKQDIHDRQYGSKLILVVEQCQCVTVWGAKGCLILLYLRLTTLRRENIAIKALASYVVITFVVMDILYFGVWCQPFHNYWAVPTPNRQCDAATNHLITNAVFNLTSDCAMLAVGLPMFLRMQLPWQKKFPVVGIFSLGIFTILAAILNKVYSFSEPFGSLWTFWYVRESSTALLVANLPFVWTFWRRVAGFKPTIGQSRTNSATMIGTVDPRFDDGSVKAIERNFSPPNTADDVEDFEMAGGLRNGATRKGSGMTFAEMLLDDTRPASNEKEPNPITHPGLFYSRGQGFIGSHRPSTVEKAVLRDRDEQQTIRRGSSQDAEFEDTPSSSVFPSLKNKESTNSFV